MNNKKFRLAGSIETYSGINFCPFHASKDDIDIVDIAHALSNICRFNGHVKHFYSVAQHCCLLAEYAMKLGHCAKTCKSILMHDASEAYINDIPRPFKHNIGWDFDGTFRSYKSVEENLSKLIFEKFGCLTYDHDIIKELDTRIMLKEHEVLFNNNNTSWSSLIDLEPLDVIIINEHPSNVKKKFLDLFYLFSINYC